MSTTAAIAIGYLLGLLTRAIVVWLRERRERARCAEMRAELRRFE